VGDVFAAHEDTAVVELFEPGDGPQGRCLATTRRAEEADGR
jgi:hypothetical protein